LKIAPGLCLEKLLMRLLIVVAVLLAPALCAQSGIWIQETSNPPWLGRHMQRNVVFDDKIWMVGGYTNTFLNEI
jgi:hypothetical protein